jgi:hypothetical protein
MWKMKLMYNVKVALCTFECAEHIMCKVKSALNARR